MGKYIITPPVPPVYRGDTIPLRVAVTRNGLAMDITLCTFILTGRKWKGDANYLFRKSDGAVNLTDPENGICVITVDPSDTEPFTDTLDVHCDVEMTESNGRKTTIAYGILPVIVDISRT